MQNSHFPFINFHFSFAIGMIRRLRSHISSVEDKLESGQMKNEK